MIFRLRAMEAVLLFLAWCVPADATVTCGVTTTSVAFGTIPGLVPININSIGTITVTCSGDPNSGAALTVAMNQGGAGSFSPRIMVSGSNRLNYNLYSDATHTTIWGDGTATTGTVSTAIAAWAVGDSGTANLTVYGQVPTNQNVPPGSYGDIVTVTVTY